MDKRKQQKKDNRRLSGLFFQVGLLAALMLVFSAFEYRSKREVPDYPLDITNDDGVIEVLIPRTKIATPKPPPAPKTRVINPVPTDAEIEVQVKDILPTIEVPEDDPVIEIETATLPVEVPDDLPFDIVEEMPSPKGGLDALYKYIGDNLKYPSSARRLGIEGTVFLSFVVDENGNMTDLKVVKGIGAGCDDEVMRIFENPPKWNAGKQRGVPVKVRQMIPIKFALQDR